MPKIAPNMVKSLIDYKKYYPENPKFIRVAEKCGKIRFFT